MQKLVWNLECEEIIVKNYYDKGRYLLLNKDGFYIYRANGRLDEINVKLISHIKVGKSGMFKSCINIYDSQGDWDFMYFKNSEKKAIIDMCTILSDNGVKVII